MPRVADPDLAIVTWKTKRSRGSPLAKEGSHGHPYQLSFAACHVSVRSGRAEMEEHGPVSGALVVTHDRHLQDFQVEVVCRSHLPLRPIV